MKIRSLRTWGVRALPERELSFCTASGSPANVVAVTGPLASGKTTVLQTLVAAKELVGSYGVPPDSTPLAREPEEPMKIQVTWELSDAEMVRYEAPERVIDSEVMVGGVVRTAPHDPILEEVLSEYHPGPSYGKLEYFHASRSFPIRPQVDLSQEPGGPVDRIIRLDADDEKYSGLVRYIVEAGLGLHRDENGEPLAEGRVTRAFEALCTTKRLGGLYQAGGSILPGFVDGEERRFGLGQLSAGELDLLLFATTWVRAGLVDNAGSVVLIDNPERHLGDEGAKALIAALSSLGPNNQLIVATNARAVLGLAAAVVELGG